MDKHMREQHQKDEKELILKPYSYAFVLDKNSGNIKTFTGPIPYTMTPNDVPVVFEDNQFRECRLGEAIKPIPIAVEGFYLVVLNPSVNGKQPEPKQQLAAPDLDIGRRINMHGPVSFTPWPGQKTEVIRGHHLRSNEYLIVKVYNEEEARKNWGAAVIKPASSEEGQTSPALSIDVPEDLSVGKHYVIKGTEVSFYMPPTGVSVVPAKPAVASNSPEKFVRQALTLEVLEYSILVDEDGNKRYERGPCVVFPKPTEKFVEKDGRSKFRAIELNEIQGLHIKVIAPYTDEKGVKHEEGDELFITGKDTAIYYPREEHSSVSYDGKNKHFATAVPAGEGRYLMDRITGEIKTKLGPMMLLPDPRNQVIVRRVLNQSQCQLWYPGNKEVLEYNQNLAGIAKTVPTTRSGAISDGDYERSAKAARGLRGAKAVRVAAAHEISLQNRDQRAIMDEISRSSTYTQPRTVTFDNKFAGVPRLDIWTGYAVMVVSATGERRVEIGPKSVLLNYDESLEAMSLSTGTPKNDENLLKTVYLRVKNNSISDWIIDAETVDHVKTAIPVSYAIDFEGDSSKWWNFENYVKHVTEHVRSVVKGAVKKITIETFYANSVDILRNVILGKTEEGKGRPGMVFENGARIKDVEVLGVKIQDERISALLNSAQHQVVKTNIELAQAKRDLTVAREQEIIAREKLQEHQRTEIFKNTLNGEVKTFVHKMLMGEVERSQEADSKRHEGNIKKIEAQAEIKANSLDIEKLEHIEKMRQRKEEQDMEVERLVTETDAFVKRATCIQPELAHNLETFRQTLQVESLAKGLGELAVIEGKSVSKTFKSILDHLPQNLQTLIVPQGNNGPKQLKD